MWCWSLVKNVLLPFHVHPLFDVISKLASRLIQQSMPTYVMPSNENDYNTHCWTVFTRRTKKNEFQLFKLFTHTHTHTLDFDKYRSFFFQTVEMLNSNQVFTFTCVFREVFNTFLLLISHVFCIYLSILILIMYKLFYSCLVSIVKYSEYYIYYYELLKYKSKK